MTGTPPYFFPSLPHPCCFHAELSMKLASMEDTKRRNTPTIPYLYLHIFVTVNFLACVKQENIKVKYI